jgi:prepilin peptidase CpaA
MNMILKIVLCLILFVSFVTDIRNRKILNLVTLPSIIFALIYYTFTSGLEGFLFSVKGFLVGLSMLLIPYLLGGMGAGDVKLMAAIGALMGTSFVLYSFICTALIGGAIAITLIIKRKGVRELLKNFLFNLSFLKGNLGSIVLKKENNSSRISFPYGVAIVLGTFCTLIWGGF